MRGMYFSALGILLLAGCQNRAADVTKSDAVSNGTAALAAGNATTSTVRPESPAMPVETSAADEAAVRATIDKGYGSYNKQSDEAFANSTDFKKAWSHAVGKDGAMPYDPYCRCQDFEKVRWKIDSVDLKGDKARANVRVDVFSQGQWVKLWIDFRRVDGTWLVDDLANEDGKSLKSEMKAAEPGSWDVGA